MSKPDLGHQLTDKELEALEKRIAKLYKEARNGLDKEVKEYFASFKRRDEAQKAKMEAGEITPEQYTQWRLNQIGRGERFKALRDEMAKRYTDANEVAVSYVNDATPGVYSLNRNYAAYTIEAAGADVSFTLFDEQTVKRLMVEQPDLMPYYPKNRALKRGIDLAYGKKQITASVTSGILMGKSVGKIATDLQTRMETMNRASAVRTARTAVTGAQNAGRMDSYAAAEKMGIELEREWLATLDNRTRHAHAMLDGQRRPMGKPFNVDGQTIMFPGDPTAKGYLVYNCRCTLVPVVKGVDTSDALRRDRDGLLSDMTYAQWEASKRGYSANPVSKYNRDNWTENVAKKAIEKYTETIKSLVELDFQEIYDLAKSGERHKGVYKDALKKSREKLEKSIASHVGQVKEHDRKLAAPHEHDEGWDKKDDRQKKGLLKKWEKDRRRNAEQAAVEISVWKERFGNEQ